MKTRSMTLTVALAAVLALAAAQPCAGATLTVTSTADDGDGTLRAALASAADGDTINITATGTIALTGGALVVDKSVTITGPGQAQLTVDGQSEFSVFFVWSATTKPIVTISGLTIANGMTGSLGGGVYNGGTLMLRDCTLSRNDALEGGGGVVSYGPLCITRCTLSGNTATSSPDSAYGGGAVAFFAGVPGATMTIEDSLLTGNTAPYGGGIVIHVLGNADFPAHASVTVANCTLSGNTAAVYDGGSGGIGGGIAIFVRGESPAYSSATVTVESSTLSGNSASGEQSNGGAIFNLSDGGSASLALRNSTLSGNWASATSEGGYGGAICTAGSAAVLTVDNCRLNDNNAPDLGGAIFNLGTLNLVNSTLNGNSAVNGGGAIYNAGWRGIGVATATITGCKLTDNSVTGLMTSDADVPVGGGAIWNSASRSVASLTIEDSTLNGNSAQFGGAILNYSEWDNEWDNKLDPSSIATVNIARSTLSGNFAMAPDSAGGGAIASVIQSEGSILIKNSTLANNSASLTSGGTPAAVVGGAIVASHGVLSVDNSTLSGNADAGSLGLGGASGIFAGNGCITTIKNTILANDSSGPNLAVFDPAAGDTITSCGYNLCTDDGGGFLDATGDQFNVVDPNLGPLANNGGPTWTCALLLGSPALNAGSETDIANNPVTVDQRGVARLQGGANDIGAFELLQYSWSGVLPPVNPDGTSVFKAGSTVPVKFMLTGVSASITDLIATFSGAQVSDGIAGSVNESVPTAAATAGNLFRYDPTTNQYVFNWSTKGLARGTYRLFVILGDGVERTVDVGLR